METKQLQVHEGNDEGADAERQEQMCVPVFQQLPFFFFFLSWFVAVGTFKSSQAEKII